VTRALCTILLLSALFGPAAADDKQTANAILLIAGAKLRDPNFSDAVVLVMNNIGPAPAGLIVNRPTKMTVSQLFPELEPLAHTEDRVYFGGPVHLGSVSFLLRADAPPEDATRVLDGVYLSTSPKLLRRLLARTNPMKGLRIFVGYSGWGSGQLEGEIARGDWTLAPATADAIFGGKREHPWPGPRTSGDAQRS
jgi:putative transcriptional regulator